MRVDLRFGTGPDGRIFLMNKHDGVVREPFAVSRSENGVVLAARVGPRSGASCQTVWTAP